MNIEIYDTTLRDGEQGAGVSFTAEDKKAVIEALDALGCDCIEAGSFMSGGKFPEGDPVFSLIDYSAVHAEIAAFCSTRRPYTGVEKDEALCALAGSRVKTAAVFGKCWTYQVEAVLNTTLEENLAMIRDTVSFLRGAGKRVVFDAEHFFDGYSDNPSYAMSAVRAAFEAGADTIALCDTNGGNLPDVIGMVVSAVRDTFPGKKIGIHCHNDLGMAVACSLEAVLSGASQVQGSIAGIGERCGNANLCTLIPLLQLKMGFSCVPDDKLSSLTRQARRICELANLAFNENEPFVGGYAFAHKAGMHIDGVAKTPRSFEHISPELVGNERNTLVSGLSGRAAIHEKVTALRPGLDKNSPEVQRALDRVLDCAAKGYQYENAEASLSLIIRDALGIRESFFRILNYQILINESTQGENMLCTAMIKVAVGDMTEITAAEGEGPVNAFDLALRRALLRFYPVIGEMRLSDYKVRVLGSSMATASKVRVFVESTDGQRVWRTIGVSADIVDASRQALCDAVEYLLCSRSD